MAEENKSKPGLFNWVKNLKNYADETLAIVGVVLGAKHLTDALRGKEVPETAHPAIQALSKGGKDSFVDEARMIPIKLVKLTRSELKVIRGLEAFVASEYGDGFFGDLMEKRYGNKLRPGLLHLVTESKQTVDKIAKVMGDKTIYDEIPRTELGNDDNLVIYLKYLVKEIRAATKVAVGTEEEKTAAGYRHGLKILRYDGFPDLQFAEFAKMADAALAAFPSVRSAKTKATTLISTNYPPIRDAVVTTSRDLNQAVIDRSDRIDARKWYHPLRLFGW